VTSHVADRLVLFDAMVEERPPAMRPRRRSDRKLFTLGDLANAGRIIGFMAPPPPRCVCGGPDYYFYIDNSRDRLIAECRDCRYKRVWSVPGKGWGPFT